jgi:pimeloyl-ACP methyl ester carboxylesterase
MMSGISLNSPLAKPVSSLETAGYRAMDNEQSYYVYHKAPKPVAQVLLAGHFVMERLFAYAAWMRWARYLAEHNLSALRFDYRGCGESTGAFHHFTLRSWLEDCRAWHQFLRQQQPDLPIVLCGIGMGGLLMSNLFSEGLGDAMLLWSPSASGSDALRDTIIRRMATEMANAAGGKPKTWADYKAQFEQGQSIQGGGYTLTPELWSGAAQMKFVTPEGGREQGKDATGRPWKIVKLGMGHIPLIPGGGIWQALNPKVHVRIRRVPLNPDLSSFYRQNTEWLQSELVTRKQEVA